MIKFTLKVKRNDEAAKEQEIILRLGEKIIIGRSSCDISLYDPVVSQEHFSIENLSGQLTVTDLESANHTWIDGIPIQTYKVRMPTKIVIGDNHIFISAPELIDDVEKVAVEDEARAPREGSSPTVFGHSNENPMFIEKAFSAAAGEEESVDGDQQQNILAVIVFFLEYFKQWFHGPVHLATYLKSNVVPSLRYWLFFIVLSFLAITYVENILYTGVYNSFFLVSALFWTVTVSLIINGFVLFLLYFVWLNSFSKEFNFSHEIMDQQRGDEKSIKVQLVFFCIVFWPILLMLHFFVEGILDNFSITGVILCSLLAGYYSVSLIKEIFNYNLYYSNKRVRIWLIYLGSFLVFYLYSSLYSGG